MDTFVNKIFHDLRIKKAFWKLHTERLADGIAVIVGGKLQKEPIIFRDVIHTEVRKLQEDRIKDVAHLRADIKLSMSSRPGEAGHKKKKTDGARGFSRRSLSPSRTTSPTKSVLEPQG